MSTYVYHKLNKNGWFIPDNVCHNQYYEPCQYCNKKDKIMAYYQYDDWRQYSQRAILVSYYRHLYKITQSEAETMVEPDHQFYYFRFYCDHCKAKYLEKPIRGSTSIDDDGESALNQATAYWNTRKFDEGRLLCWEK